MHAVNFPPLYDLYLETWRLQARGVGISTSPGFSKVIVFLWGLSEKHFLGEDFIDFSRLLEGQAIGKPSCGLFGGDVDFWRALQ